jgi:hypothetical protein
MPDFNTNRLMKYSRFMVKTAKENNKLRNIFADRVPSVSFFLQSVKRHELETPFLNTLQFLCDVLVSQAAQGSKSTQTDDNYYVVPDCQQISPIKFANNDNFLVEADLGFDVSGDSESMVKDMNLQSERLVKLHKQISDTMFTNKLLLKNPLKADHIRSRSDSLRNHK